MKSHSLFDDIPIDDAPQPQRDGAMPMRGEPIVLLLGGVGHEGVISALVQSGRRYKRKELRSSPENWLSICEVFSEYRVTLVLVKFAFDTYADLLKPEFSIVSEALLEKIAKLPHAVFIHANVYNGIETPGQFGENFEVPCPDTRTRVHQRLADHGIEVYTYNRNSEVTVIAQEIASRSDGGLLFRIYVPNAQLWASETDRLLQLFRDYLTRVAGVDVRLEAAKQLSPENARPWHGNCARP